MSKWNFFRSNSFHTYIIILAVNVSLLLFYILWICQFAPSSPLSSLSTSKFYLHIDPDDVHRIITDYEFTWRKESEQVHKHQEQMKQRQTLHVDYDWWAKDGEQLPYFFVNGSIRPDTSDKRWHQLAIWPEQTDHDRIVNQLMYIPPDHDQIKQSNKLKKIFINNPNHSFNKQDVPNGQSRFLSDNCPVNTCEIIRNRHQAHLADAILFKDYISGMWFSKPNHQIWIYYNLESAANTPMAEYAHWINWTATYRSDSDIVAPYGKFVLYSGQQLPVKLTADQRQNHHNYSANKIHQVAWFASNCVTKNKRLQFVRKLQKYVQVDIYGRCGDLKCSRLQSQECFSKLKNDYKFYLALENSNCNDYITEKLFINALSNNVIPIVMGARPQDYLKAAPPESYIHVEYFQSIRDLSAYLNELNQNWFDYNRYFAWHQTGEFINTFFWCRLCAMLHAPTFPKSYPNLAQWWNNRTTCRHSQKKFVKFTLKNKVNKMIRL